MTSIRRSSSVKSDSSDSDRTHRVSFNRDVHVKRYGRLQRQLSNIAETDDELETMRGAADGTESTAEVEQTHKQSTKRKEKTVGGKFKDKIKSFFARKTSSTPPKEDPVKSRYTVYTAPDITDSWSKSLDRRSKRSEERRYSDNDFRKYETNRHREKQSRSYPKYLDETSDTDWEPPRYGSLIYLHAPQVRDIPSRTSVAPPRPHRSRKAVTRSVSMTAPWAPTLRPTTRHESGTQTVDRRSRRSASTVGHSSRSDYRPSTSTDKYRPLPELVFTGPSLSSTLHRDFRGRI